MKKLLLPLFLIIFLPLMPFSDATLDLSNKQLVSNDGSIILEFGENTEKTFFTNSKITPNLEFGIIKLSEQKFLFDSTDLVSVRILGDSIFDRCKGIASTNPHIRLIGILSCLFSLI